MEKATKRDLQALKAKLDMYRERLEDVMAQMNDATVETYIGLMRRQSEIRIKLMATEEAIARINNKSFCKNAPERHITVSLTTQNRFQK